jgi:hypothetical protein
MEISSVLFAAWAVPISFIGVPIWLFAGDPAPGVSEMPATANLTAS